MTVDLVVGDLSDERPVFRENLVVWFVAGEFIEPIATPECLLPYFRTTEFLEILNPHIPVYFLDMFQGGNSCHVRSG